MADYLSAYLRLPDAAAPDAVHLAVASHYAVDYLLTWNLKHLANGRVRRALLNCLQPKNIFVPTICTPEELSDWEDVNMTDEIVEEVHAAREKIWKESGRDFKKFIERLIRLQEEHPERLVGEVPRTDPEPLPT